MQIEKKTLRKLFLCVLGCIVLYWILRDTERARLLISNIWGIISPFAVGAAIAFVFNVPMRAVERQLKGFKSPGLRRTVAILLTILLMVLVIAFVVELLVPQIRLTVESLVARLPDFIKRESANILNFLAAHPEIEEWILERTEMENIEWNTVVKRIVEYAGDSLSTIMEGAVSAIGGLTSAIGSVTTGIVNAFVSIAFAFYALARKEILARQGRRLLYSFLSEQAADEVIRVVRLTNTTFSNFISGQCLEAMILGGMFAVSMAICGMPYIPLVSVIIAITALIPLVGAFAGCILGAVFILVESPMQAVYFVILFLFIQQIEGNLIYPRVVGTSIGLPGMWVLAALTVGGELMGVGGMLVMIPLASVMYTLLGEFTRKRVKERGIDPEKLKDHPPELKSKFKEKREKRREQRLLRKMKELAEKSADQLLHKHPSPDQEQSADTASESDTESVT